MHDCVTARPAHHALLRQGAGPAGWPRHNHLMQGYGCNAAGAMNICLSQQGETQQQVCKSSSAVLRREHEAGPGVQGLEVGALPPDCTSKRKHEHFFAHDP